MGGSVPATLPGEAGTSAFREVEVQSGEKGGACCEQESYLYLLSCLTIELHLNDSVKENEVA